MTIRVIHGDCLIELPKLAAAGERFHAVVTDPPYGLEFMGKEWDGANGFRRSLNEADAGRDSVFGRTSQHGPEYQTGAHWQTGAGFSKPGIGQRETPWPAFTGGNDEFGGANPTCATCGGRVRGKKKCTCGEPDWRVKGAAPDKMYGRHRQMQTYQAWCEAWARAVYDVLLPGAYLFAFGGTRTSHRLVCAIEDAGFEIRDTVAWLYGSGFPKSLDVSKAIDRAAGAERPVVGEIKRWGNNVTGGRGGQFANGMAPPSDGTNRVDPVTAPATPEAEAWQGWGTALKPAFEPIVVARKPLDGTVAANVLKHGCGGLNIDASRVDVVDGDVRSGGFGQGNRPWVEGDIGGNTVRHGRPLREARRNEQSDLDRVAYGQGLAGSKAIGETTLGRWPANVVHDGSEDVLAAFPDAPGQLAFVGEKNGKRDSVNCYGDYGARPDTPPRIETDKSAARFFYTAKADKADRADSKHPTVKPVDLIRWLVTLACPPGGHVLDCFAGSGTTGEACMLAGFDCTLIEREAQHARDIEHRIKRWSGLDAPLFAEPHP